MVVWLNMKHFRKHKQNWCVKATHLVPRSRENVAKWAKEVFWTLPKYCLTGKSCYCNIMAQLCVVDISIAFHIFPNHIPITHTVICASAFILLLILNNNFLFLDRVCTLSHMQYICSLAWNRTINQFTLHYWMPKASVIFRIPLLVPELLHQNPKFSEQRHRPAEG